MSVEIDPNPREPTVHVYRSPLYFRLLLLGGRFSARPFQAESARDGDREATRPQSLGLSVYS